MGTVRAVRTDLLAGYAALAGLFSAQLRRSVTAATSGTRGETRTGPGRLDSRQLRVIY